MHTLIRIARNRSAADHIHRFDAMPRIRQAVSPAGQNFTIAGRVQIGEAFGELELLAADVDIAVRRFLAFDAVRQVVGIDGQKPPHPGPLVFQIASRLGFFAQVNAIVLKFAEDEVQHVEEVHPDVGGHAK